MDTFKPTAPMPSFGKPASIPPNKHEAYDPLFSGPATRKYLGIGVTTEWRWQNDPNVGYPPPDLIINGRNYRRQSTLNNFLSERAAKTKAARNA
jgi:hypothetical protein